MAWKSSSRKKRVNTAHDHSVVSKLQCVELARRPFEQLSRRMIEHTLARCHLPEGLIVEVGAGDGQLRKRLPAALLRRLVSTEPDPAVSRLFRKRHPGVPILGAAAERLPFETGSVAAVIGLCVMDVVREPRAVVQELARVLKPGGCFIHWLDMSTILDEMIDALRRTGLVAFPNFLGDPSANEWPQDLYLISREAVAILIDVLSQAGEPIARSLAQYLAAFCSGSSAAATAELIQLQESATLRRALSTAFAFAVTAASVEVRAKLASFRADTFSTARYFDAKIRALFMDEAAFDAGSCIERAWEVRVRRDAEISYRSCFVGEQRHLSYLPSPRLCENAGTPGEGEMLLELGMLTFVAIRRESSMVRSSQSA